MIPSLAMIMQCFERQPQGDSPVFSGKQGTNFRHHTTNPAVGGIQSARDSVYPDMQSGPEEEIASYVSLDDFDLLMHSIQGDGGNARDGIFGPRSVTWKINRESALFLGAGRAALLQLAHPWVTASLEQHSTTFSNPIGRFHQTFCTIYTMVFGSREQAVKAARRLYRRHVGIRGEMPRAVVSYPAGSHYEANEIRALRWVYATLVESAVLAYGFVLPPLTMEKRETYYAESKRMAVLFGLPPATLPKTWTAFTEYIRQMQGSDLLGVDERARAMAHQLLRGSGSWVVPPRWYRALTAWWLPDRFREEFALPLNVEDHRALARARTRIPAVYTRLPKAIRWVGPYHEAVARLNKNRSPGWAIRASSRFWIGQPRLMFSEEVEGNHAIRSQ